MNTFWERQSFPHPSYGMLELIKTGQTGDRARRRHASFAHNFRAGIAGFDQLVHGVNLMHGLRCGEIVFP